MDRISSILPIGPRDELAHRGARRQSARYPVNADVRVIEPLEAEGVVLNASAGGLRVALDRAIDVGTHVSLDLTFPHDHASHEFAEVIWVRELPDGCLVGLRFLSH